jgi:RNA polymerase sigma-70 factor (ECF subfamily)
MSQQNNRNNVFEEIIENFSSFIKAHIQKCNPQKEGIDPEDVSQEVKIKLWKILKDEKKIKNYSSYIKKIINSTVIDQIRISRRQKRILNQEEFFGRDINRTKNDFHNKEYRQIVGEAVNYLKESRRVVVRLFLLDIHLDEISIYLNWSKSKTQNLLYRGMADLKRKLKEQEINFEN